MSVSTTDLCVCAAIIGVSCNRAEAGMAGILLKYGQTATLDRGAPTSSTPPSPTTFSFTQEEFNVCSLFPEPFLYFDILLLKFNRKVFVNPGPARSRYNGFA
jgi:hypothetical protein